MISVVMTLDSDSAFSPVAVLRAEEGGPRKSYNCAVPAAVLVDLDIVSQAEREVFAHHVRKVNPRAGVVFVNGITGQGAMSLLRQLRFSEFDTLQERRLRFTMPSALCSYCTGQTRIGRGYQMGNVRKMEFGGTGNDG